MTRRQSRETSTESEFLSAPEVAEWLQVPLSTVYALAKDGRIPSVRIGTRVRFRTDRIEQWLTEQENGVGR